MASRNNVYQQLPQDSSSSDDSIIDIDIGNNIHNRHIPQDYSYNRQNARQNSVLNDGLNDYDDIPLVDNNVDEYSRIQTPNLITFSPYYKNNISNRINWNILFIQCVSIICLLLIIYSYNAIQNNSGIDIYKYDVKYINYYFLILLILYITYISNNLFIFMILVCVCNIAKDTIHFALLLNNYIFKINLLLRLVVIVFIINSIINDIPFTTISLNQTNMQHTTNIDYFLPRHIQYMIIEMIIYGYLSYLIGMISGIIKIIQGYY
jgi:hypothetical protein